MRLGEIKNIVKLSLNDSKQIDIQQETLYGGQAYQIKNFPEIINALDILSKQKWNQLDFKPIEQIKLVHDQNLRNIILTVEEFNQLNSYVASVNEKVPLFYSVLENFVEDQDEKIINIKLPEGVGTLQALDEVNKRLEDILKAFNIDGQFELKGFDKGTEWYNLLAPGILSYQYLVSCLKIAQEFLKARAEYFKSEQARISYEACLKDGEEFTDAGFGKFKDSWLKIFIEKEVRKVLDEIPERNGHTPEELNTKLVIATTKLVKELGQGTEFHLSLNPPEYASEQAGQFVIDYKKIKALKPKKEEKPKELGTANTENVEKKSDEK